VVTKNEIKFVQSLHRKKYRQKYGQFIVEGTKSVLELIHSNFVIENVYATAAWINEYESGINIDITEASTSDLDRMSFFKTPSPVLAVCNFARPKLNETDNWIIALDGINDPGNLGTIIRIADWYGIAQIWCSEDTVDLYNPKTISSTMGSFTRVEVVYTNLESALEGTSRTKYFALMDGESVYSLNDVQPGILVIGSEANGIRQDLLENNHTAVTIPRRGNAESLNAGVATAILVDRLIGG
jgi:TrmH family RNA methyltransferase